MRIRRMNGADWKWCRKREYTSTQFSFGGVTGTVSRMLLKEVTSPLLVKTPSGNMPIADTGFIWLQFAPKGLHFWLTAMFDAEEKLIELYFDITGGNYFDNPELPWFDDMFLDIVVLPDGEIRILDRDELDDALANGTIDQTQYDHAVKECERLYLYLLDHRYEVVAFCKDWMEHFKENQ